MSRPGGLLPLAIVATVLGTAWSSIALGANEPAVESGVQFLRGQAGHVQVGEAALIGLALLKADYPPEDPTVAACLAKVLPRLAGSYVPERKGGADVYEAAVVGMMLANFPDQAKQSELGMVAQYLMSKQKPNGSWDYDGRTQGDTSISQYAVLGLWECENGGVPISPGVWDRAAQWFLSVQSSAGSWNYHRDTPSYQETVAMTAAGVGSLLICRRQLGNYRRPTEIPSPLLIPLTAEGPKPPYEIQTSRARIDQAVRRGLSWLGSNFSASNSPSVGPTPYYALYGIERLGALAEKDTLGRIDWFEQGRRFIHSTQAANGSWTSAHGAEVNTVWSIFFLTRSTAKTLRRIEVKRLAAGTLLGGRLLPRDLSTMTVAAGRVVSRPMNGAVEGMLAVLEDPRAENAASALAGLVARYETQGPAVLRPYKDRFRKLLTDRDPGLRRVAAWALSRTGDLDVIPQLIGALTDPDEDVVTTAKIGLQLLSRKIKGLGPPEPSTPEQRKEAARKWQEWYDTIRPLEIEGRSEDAAKGPVENREGNAPAPKAGGSR